MRSVLATTLVALALLASGCGDSGDSGDSGNSGNSGNGSAVSPSDELTELLDQLPMANEPIDTIIDKQTELRDQYLRQETDSTDYWLAQPPQDGPDPLAGYREFLVSLREDYQSPGDPSAVFRTDSEVLSDQVITPRRRAAEVANTTSRYIGSDVNDEISRYDETRTIEARNTTVSLNGETTMAYLAVVTAMDTTARGGPGRPLG